MPFWFARWPTSTRDRPADAPTIDPGLTEFERNWEPHVLAFRQGSMKLPDFCKQQGLDPTRLRIAVRKHYRRKKAQVGQGA